MLHSMHRTLPEQPSRSPSMRRYYQFLRLGYGGYRKVGGTDW